MVAQGYAQAYRAAAVLTASPGQLVLMLFDGALKSMAIAREAFDRPPSDFKRFEVINNHLVKAQRILAELQGGLDMEQGGEFALEACGVHVDILTTRDPGHIVWQDQHQVVAEPGPRTF